MAGVAMPRGGPEATWLDRAYEPHVLEWLDDPAVPQTVKDAAMEGLDRFNARSMGYLQFTRWAVDALPTGTSRPTVLELGAGNGALARRLARRIRGRVLASDVCPHRVAHMAADPELGALGVEVLRLDATDIALPDHSVDLALFVQGLHHLEAPQVVRLLEDGTRVARRLLIIDGWRHPLMLCVTPVIWMLGNYPAFRDGVVSLRRMYSKGAFEYLTRKAAVRLDVRCGFAVPGYFRAVVERA